MIMPVDLGGNAAGELIKHQCLGKAITFPGITWRQQNLL
jgi:hypothetical protein